MEKKHTGVLFCVLCCVGILGVGLFSLPTAAAYFGDTFFWGYIALGAGVALAVVVLFCTAFEKTVAETCQASFARVGNILSLLYAGSYTAVSAFLFAYYAYTVQNWFLDGVPRLFIALFLIAL